MYRLFACTLLGWVAAGPGFAQTDANEIRKLTAEADGLRAENARLKDQLRSFAAALQAAQAAQDEEAKLEGVWVIEAATRDGKAVASDQGGEVEFRGNRVVARLPGNKKPIHQWLGVSPAVKQISFGSLPGKGGVPTLTSFDLCNGLYELDGHTLRISLISAYAIPKEVSDKGQVLWVLKRKPS